MMFEMAACTGCRTCEMSCSFKHTGEFRPKLAAISIVEKPNEAGFLISIDSQTPDTQGQIHCMGCLECLKYFPADEALKKIIVRFLKKKRQAEKKRI